MGHVNNGFLFDDGEDLIGFKNRDGDEMYFARHATASEASAAALRLREWASATDFGAVGDGVVDDTAALKAAFDYCMPRGKLLQLCGTYLVSGPITSPAALAACSLHLRCLGAVAINVSAAAASFRNLVYCESTAANNASVVGGSLDIDLNSKCASGITVRHNAAKAGVVHFEAPVTVRNAKNNDAAAVYENQGILVYGDYASVVLNMPTVVGVDRTNVAGGACKGITVAGFTGEVTLNQPHVENILCTGSTAEADGIAIFSKAQVGTYNKREGVATINEPLFVDCQGRSFKAQCCDVTIVRPKVRRRMVVSVAEGCDFDFQFGNGLLIEPDYEYRLNGVTSPLGANFTPVYFQQLLDDAPMHAKSIGGTLRTEAAMVRYAGVIHQATALASESEVSGLRVQALGAFATTAFTRAILESKMDTVVAKSTKTKLVVRDVAGPITVYAIGYTDYAAGALTAKLSWEVSGLRNTLPLASTNVPFKNLSGNQVLAVESFMVRGNTGYRDLLTGAIAFTMNTLPVGCAFTVDLSAAVVTGAPAWGAVGYGFVECLGQFFDATDKNIRASVGNASAANTVFWTQNGGTTWGTLK
jgi:hypothetical protein